MRRARALILLALMAAAGAAPAADVSRGQGALLRGLDKLSGKSSDLLVGVGETATLGRLEVRLGECRFPSGNPSADAYAQMTITDIVAHETVFSGWMIASSPAISALDHPRYDLWVISCQS